MVVPLAAAHGDLATILRGFARRGAMMTEKMRVCHRMEYEWSE